VLSVSVELGLVVCRLDDTDYYSLDLVDLYTSVSMRKVELMSHLIREGPSIIHGTDLIIAISDLRTGPSSQNLHSFNIQTGQHNLVDNASEDYQVFAIAHHSHRLILASANHECAEIRNISQEATTRSTSRQDPLLGLTISLDGETLLATYSDRFEVQTLQGVITSTHPVTWSLAHDPQISRSHDGTFIAARTRRGTAAHGVTLYHIDTRFEVFRPCATSSQMAPVFSHSAELLAYDDAFADRLIVCDFSGDTGTLTFDIPQGISLFELQFAQDDKTLFTSKGFIRIDTVSGVWTPWPKPMALPKMMKSGITYAEGWIRSGSDRKDLMWVPPHYRPTYERASWTFDASDRTIVLWNPDSMVAMKIAEPIEF
jgi:hypothetical protein